ncbi:MAG: hypothetical protein WDA59_04075 [Methanofastidiosum sp.]
MVKRTEEDKISQAGIKVVLGGKEYKVRPLRILESREWREQVTKLLGNLPRYVKADTNNPEEFEKALQGIMVEMPDKIVDLFFGYAKDLPRQEIEAEATDEEVANALVEVLQVAFPLLPALTKAMGNLA